MRKFFFIFIIICISLISKSQEKGDFRLGVYTQVNTYRDKEMPMFGLCGEYFLDHRWALNYRYGLGLNNNGDVTAHVNPSLLGLLFLRSGEALALSFMIPEGFSYHAYPNEKIEISPYLNPLGSEINFYDNPGIVLSCSFGINAHIKPAKDISITPNFGAMVFYRNGEIIPSVGLSVNYNFH